MAGFFRFFVPVGCLWALAVSAAAQAPQPTDDSTPLPPVKTSVTVTAKISEDTPASITALDNAALLLTPGINLDDRLRMIPGFSLFRRSSSLVANPTTQGVSLRGLASTGASRTLVLWDGIPLNDPFGGWVYWTRVAPDQLDSVEVSRGASTSLFGDLAMGGAIALFSRPAEPYHGDLSFESGSESTNEASGSFSGLWGRFGVSSQLRAFGTDGYFVVPTGLRGTADRRANVRFVSGATRLEWLGTRDQVFVKLDILAEERQNGTALTRNSTSLGTLSAHYSHEAGNVDLSLLAYHTREDYRSTYSSISASRNVERLTDTQQVPSQGTGAAAYAKLSEPRWHLMGGADVGHVTGTSYDHLAGNITRAGGGSLLEHGVFGQFDASAGPVQLYAGARYHVTGTSRNFFTPSFGIAAGKGGFRVRGSVYRAFRAPTLNELYRQFRVGNVVTLANASLVPETLFGAEAGFDWSGQSRRFSLTLFRNSLDQLITNSTLTTTPTLITRQRENAGPALSRGFEANFQQRWRSWRGELSYLYADSRFNTGHLIPEVARHQGSARVSYQHGGTLASAGIRASSSQFDDDLNQFLLPGYAVLQFIASQRIQRHVTATAAIENLLDREYLVAFTPTPNTGEPRLWRVGLRWDGRIH